MVEKQLKRDYSYYENLGSIISINPNELKNYLRYFEIAYKEDLQHAKDSLISSPKWSIIAGYYAMHNISKYYLGLNFNKKITLPDIHIATIIAIKELVDDREVKKLIKEIENFSEIDPLHFGLIKAKEQRAKTQYYINENESLKKITLEKANYFLNNVVEKYIEILEELIKKC